jgi:carnosine N-methyltransferase
MCRGDFVEVFNESSQAGMWDAVVTCFFIDTAHNIIEYIETISKILKDGGVLINLGPLLYHFADEQGLENEMSIELSLEDVKRVASHYGFEMEKEKTIETTYSTNPRSMMKNRYYPVFWTMRKKCAITTT